MKIRFGINSILFLGLVLGTLLIWVGFEYYHQQNDVEIPSKLRLHAGSTLPDSFDSETLKTIYQNGKDKFYEPVDSQSNQ